MKKFLLFLLIVGVAAYVYWPYHTVTKFEDALRAADKDALERIVDFPAVRQSLKDQFKAKMGADALDAARSEKSAGAAEHAKMATALFAGAVADKVIESMVTPEAVTRLLKMDQAARSGTSFTLQDKSWHTPTEFTARGSDGTRFKFRLKGIDGWRVVLVEPGEILGRQAQLPR